VAELVELDKNLWVSTQELTLMGVEVGARMAVVRLASGELFVYSPVRLSEQLAKEIDALGPVGHLVAPNRFHHLFVRQWMDFYPDARSYAAPGLPKKRPDVPFHTVLDDTPDPGWAPDLAHVLVRGWPVFNETVFYHGPTRTLVCADLIHNIGREKPFISRLVYGIVGSYGGFKTGLVERVSLRDRDAGRASIERVLGWDIERVVMAHGTVLPHGGREALRKAYGWLVAT
jgi:hypothetical protein